MTPQRYRTGGLVWLAVSAVAMIAHSSVSAGAPVAQESPPKTTSDVQSSTEEAEFGRPPRDVTSEKGEKLYLARCSVCHDHARGNIPIRLTLDLKSPEAVVAALTTGPMQPMASGLTADDKREIALFLTGKRFGSEPSPEANRCLSGHSTLRLSGSDWSWWGKDPLNSLHQPLPGFGTADVSRMKLQWAFAYPGGAAVAAPVAVGDHLFVTTALGLFALDSRKGCTIWFSKAGAGAKMVTVGGLSTAPTRLLLFFGDASARVSALDAVTGEALWSVRVDEHPNARVTGPVSFFEDRIYVPVSSMEDPLSFDPTYECCTFRGSIVSLDAKSGAQIWKTFTIAHAPRPLHRHTSAGVELHGPAGAAVYAPLTIDAKRKLIFATTAESYLRDGVAGSNSIIALNLLNGEQRWSLQPIPKDNASHCAQQDEEDGCSNSSALFEFAAPAVLVRKVNGADVLLVGQKSGVLYGIDADRGSVKWETRLGEGGSLGGIEYGVTVNAGTAYVPVSDSEVKPPFRPGGLVAVDAASGKVVWRVEPPSPVCSWGVENCSSAQAAAAVSVPGIVFSGSWDGHLRAYRMRDGKTVWDVDTGGTFDAVNGVQAKGGAINGYAVTVAGGWVYVTSGAASIKRPGNVLLAFRAEP
ncbi:MAG: PQQ-binding-like beta-propeller repeat protein [Proteobacteria bacterium]|nr:PQQ-binding-like beta-propeller repeat protein [Pseudomonadota bacterium]